MSFSTNRKQIGSAIWLLELFGTQKYCTDIPPWVAKGRTIPDNELQEELGIKLQTLCVWRRKLRTAGLLHWTLKPGGGRAYLIGKLKEPTAGESTPAETPCQKLEPETKGTAPASKWVQ
jgi:hypothetical protein